MMKQTSVDSTKSPPTPPASRSAASPENISPPKVTSKIVNAEKKENFASRTMKGFMKLIGKDEATTPQPFAPTIKQPVASTQTKDSAAEKSVFKLIQTRLKQPKLTEPNDEKAEKSKEYMNQFQVQGQWAVSQILHVVNTSSSN